MQFHLFWFVYLMPYRLNGWLSLSLVNSLRLCKNTPQTRMPEASQLGVPHLYIYLWLSSMSALKRSTQCILSLSCIRLPLCIRGDLQLCITLFATLILCSISNKWTAYFHNSFNAPFNVALRIDHTPLCVSTLLIGHGLGLSSHTFSTLGGCLQRNYNSLQRALKLYSLLRLDYFAWTTPHGMSPV